MKKTKAKLCLLIALLLPAQSFAFTDGSGWVQVGYLSKILMENYQRYQQLKQMFDQAKRTKEFFKTVHNGLENATGLLSQLPIEDNGVLSDLTSFNRSLESIAELYGRIPDSPEQAIQVLHDKTVAESLRMITGFKKYAEKQEESSNTLKSQARSASPKGAARMTAESNAMVLKGVSQLIRLESQNLKLQSEILALQNKKDKEAVKSYQKINKDFGRAFEEFRPSSRFLRL